MVGSTACVASAILLAYLSPSAHSDRMRCYASLSMDEAHLAAAPQRWGFAYPRSMSVA